VQQVLLIEHDLLPGTIADSEHVWSTDCEASFIPRLESGSAANSSRFYHFINFMLDVHQALASNSICTVTSIAATTSWEARTFRGNARGTTMGVNDWLAAHVDSILLQQIVVLEAAGC
jgi:hypothetical protein